MTNGKVLKLGFIPISLLCLGACVSSSSHTSATTESEFRAENQCIAVAMSKIFEKVHSSDFRRPKWEIGLEIKETKSRARYLLISVEPIDFDPGGGGKFSYDCGSNILSLIEDFR